MKISQMSNEQYLKYLRGCLYRFKRAKVIDRERITATEELIDDVKRAIRREIRHGATIPKRTIRQNSRGLWRGYEGGRLVEPNFFDDFAAERWLNERNQDNKPETTLPVS